MVVAELVEAVVVEGAAVGRNDEDTRVGGVGCGMVYLKTTKTQRNIVYM